MRYIWRIPLSPLLTHEAWLLTSVDERTAFTSPRLPASAGDTFQVLANQNSTASVDIEATNNLTWVEVVFYG